MLKRLCVLVVLLPSLSMAQPLDEDVMPFGAYSSNPATNQTFYTPAKLQIMHDSLGINQFTAGGFYDTTAAKFANAGIYVYPWGTGVAGGIEPQTKWAGATYFVCQPESSSFYNVKFKITNFDGGYPNPESSFVVYSGSGMMLDNLGFYVDNKYAWMTPNQLQYFPSLRLKIDTTGFDSDTLVGVFRATRTWPDPDTLLFLDSIYFNDVPGDTFQLLELTNDLNDLSYFNTRPEADSTYGGWVVYEFETFGNCKVFIDNFKLHCQYGEDVVSGDPYIESQIKESVGRAGFNNFCGRQPARPGTSSSAR